MSLVGFENFGRWPNVAEGSISPNAWSGAFSSLTTPRYGGQAAVVAAGMVATFTDFATAAGGAQTTMIAGFALRVAAYPSANSQLLRFRDAANTNLSGVGLTPTGQLAFFRAGGTFVNAATDIVPLNTWVYVEVSITFNATTGAYEIRRDGLNVLAATGINAGAGINATQLGFLGMTGADATIADVYWCSTVGTVANTFLGEVRLDDLLVTSDVTTQWAATGGGGGNFGAIDEALRDDTDFVAAATAGLADRYVVANLPVSPSVIHAVAAQSSMRKTGGGVTLRNRVHQGASVANGATNAVLTTTRHFRDILPNDPATSAPWTAAGVNTAEMGIERVA